MSRLQLLEELAKARAKEQMAKEEIKIIKKKLRRK